MWAKSNTTQRVHGFTIVELLIVIVIIAVLAAVTIVAYNGIQNRAKNSARASDIAQITKALEMYYAENNKYPPGSGSTTINISWSTTVDASWANLETALKPYLKTLPADPTSTPGVSPLGITGYGYAYFSNVSAYCGAASGKMYVLVYKNNGGNSEQKDTLIGDCPSNPLGPYTGSSTYRVVKSL